MGITITVSGDAVQSRDVTLECRVNRLPLGSVIEWEYSLLPVEFMSEAYGEGRVDIGHTETSSRLTIRSLVRCDAGMYSCCVDAECEEIRLHVEGEFVVVLVDVLLCYC